MQNVKLSDAAKHKIKTTTAILRFNISTAGVSQHYVLKDKTSALLKNGSVSATAQPRARHNFILQTALYLNFQLSLILVKLFVCFAHLWSVL